MFVRFHVDSNHVLMHFALRDVTYLLLISNYEMMIAQKWETDLGNLTHSECGKR
jgi:hypothetical protein